MYPNEIIFGMDLYSILITVGIIAAMAFVRILSDHRGLIGKWQNFLLVNTVLAVVVGYGASVLTQALYNYGETGVFEIVHNTGATFYGGLLGGAAIFLISYFAVGHFLFRDGYHITHLCDLFGIAAPCITVAHGFGRLGCLMAGCCYGKATDAWYGIYMRQAGGKVIPVQLYEAIFLLCLSALLFWMFWKRKPHGLPLYMLTYGVWRYLIEFLRDDDRGQTFIRFFTPSQLISVVLVLGCVGVYFLELHMEKKAAAETAADRDASTSGEAAAEESDHA